MKKSTVESKILSLFLENNFFHSVKSSAKFLSLKSLHN